MPKDPHWADRDRFILSAGHGSMLLYSLLYLTGYEDMTIDQIKHFRQLGSKTAGHPEYGHATGIETTTGPLGQGLANSVGLALGERIMNAALRRRPGRPLHLCAGRRRLPDGRHFSQEAIALAGHLKLNKLIVFWDNNNITIDGPVSLADNTDQVARFQAVRLERQPHRRPRPGSHRLRHRSGPPVRQADDDRLQDDHRLRRADQGTAPTRRTARRSAPTRSPARASSSTGISPPFEIPADILDAWRAAGKPASRRRNAWEGRLAKAAAQKAEFERRHRRRAAARLRRRHRPPTRRSSSADKPKVATRKCVGRWRWRSSTARCRKPSAARPT